MWLWAAWSPLHTSPLPLPSASHLKHFPTCISISSFTQLLCQDLQTPQEQENSADDSDSVLRPRASSAQHHTGCCKSGVLTVTSQAKSFRLSCSANALTLPANLMGPRGGGTASQPGPQPPEFQANKNQHLHFLAPRMKLTIAKEPDAAI